MKIWFQNKRSKFKKQQAKQGQKGANNNNSNKLDESNDMDDNENFECNEDELDDEDTNDEFKRSSKKFKKSNDKDDSNTNNEDTNDYDSELDNEESSTNNTAETSNENLDAKLQQSQMLNLNKQPVLNQAKYGQYQNAGLDEESSSVFLTPSSLSVSETQAESNNPSYQAQTYNQSVNGLHCNTELSSLNKNEANKLEKNEKQAIDPSSSTSSLSSYSFSSSSNSSSPLIHNKTSNNPLTPPLASEFNQQSWNIYNNGGLPLQNAYNQQIPAQNQNSYANFDLFRQSAQQNHHHLYAHQSLANNPNLFYNLNMMQPLSSSSPSILNSGAKMGYSSTTPPAYTDNYQFYNQFSQAQSGNQNTNPQVGSTFSYSNMYNSNLIPAQTTQAWNSNV